MASKWKLSVQTRDAAAPIVESDRRIPSHEHETIMNADTIVTPGKNETPPVPASVRLPTASQNNKPRTTSTRLTPARWMIAVILGYLALLPVAGRALAVEFDTTPTQRPPVATTGHSPELADPHGAIIDDALRITLPPSVRLRDLPTPGPGRRSGGPAPDGSATRRQRR
jgi:hypothetical protein